MLVYYYVKTTYMCFFKKTVRGVLFCIKRYRHGRSLSNSLIMFKNVFFVWISNLIKSNFRTFSIKKRFTDLSHFLFLAGSGLTMTFIPRAQTFPSFLSREPEQEEGERQEEATPPSSGCEESCRLRPLQWQRAASEWWGHFTHHCRKDVELCIATHVI